MKLPAIQFYPGDWHKDQGVQSLSLMEKGAWFELLLMMHDSDERGVLLVNGQPMPDAVIARRLGLDLEAAAQILATLLYYGVASRRQDDKAFYCRRMVNDESLRQVRAKGGQEGAAHGIKGKEHGAKGGRPKKITGDIDAPARGVNKPPLNPPPSFTSSTSITKDNTLGGVGDSDRSAIASLSPSTDDGERVKACKTVDELEVVWNSCPKRHGETGFVALVKAKKKELEGGAGEKPAPMPKLPAKPVKDSITDPDLAFEVFWKAYGKTAGSKKKANGYWAKLPGDVRRYILAGLPGFIASLRERQFQPHATTFLNEERWNNESYTVPDKPIAPLKTSGTRPVSGVAPTGTFIPDIQQRFREQAAKVYR